jgi:hypothetical protein
MSLFRRPTPRLVAAGVTLRNQVNKRWPSRDKRSDGWIGDAAHQARPSDHNPDKNGWVHAIDIDHDFLGPNQGKAQAEIFANQLIELARSGKDRGRLKYVVYNNRIASGTYRDQFWTWRKGNWGHTQHIHISFTSRSQTDGTPFPLPIFDAEETKPPAPKPPAPPTPSGQFWDGVVPKIENVNAAASDPELKNMAAWRVAARLKDLGFYKGDLNPVYDQGYPRNAIVNFQKSQGWQGSGNYGEKTHNKLFLGK